MKKEIWECVKCGSPCRVEIHFSNEKLPEHLKEHTRFRIRDCPCGEHLYPDFHRVPQPAPDPVDEWEAWCDNMPLRDYYGTREIYERAMIKWFKALPERGKGE